MRQSTATADAAMTDIPLVDLGVQHREIAREVWSGFLQVIERAEFVGGAEVTGFEDAFAAFCGVAHCIGVGSGTDALELALRAAAVGAGDEVILPANTFIATAEAVVRAGARPVLVDVDPAYHLMDVEQVARVVGDRTRVLLPVDLYGQVAPMESLREVADSVGAMLLEDASQAHGARRRGRMAGSFGLAAATSFYPSKNLGAYGDAGATLTDDAEMAHRLRGLRNHGSHVQHRHDELGFNSRLDTLQAVVLLAKLARLPAWNQARRDAARRYDELLGGLPGVTLPTTLAGNDHAWHLYVVRVPHRDEVLLRLRRTGIRAAIHYRTPIHLQKAFHYLGHRPGDFPIAEAAAAEILSLPLFPGITANQQERVAAGLRIALQASGVTRGASIAASSAAGDGVLEPTDLRGSPTAWRRPGAEAIMTVRARPFRSDDVEGWEDLVHRSCNATFLHSRRFLSYHGDRFQDASIVLSSQTGSLLGVLPAAVDPSDESIVTSHPGSTYGGIVHAGALHGPRMDQAIAAAAELLRQQGRRRLLYKVVPSIYHRSPSQDDVYWLHRQGAVRCSCDLSTTIDAHHRLEVSPMRRRNLRTASRAGAVIVEGPSNLSRFWELLTIVLLERHGARPVHSLEDIQRLSAWFPDQVRCVIAEKDGEVLAGSVLFVTDFVVHAQYYAASSLGRRLCALDLVIEHCIELTRQLRRRYYDFGISTEDGGRVLNTTLLHYKTSFGAGCAVYEHYELQL
jgi:dTDP-4-amino-4,6-dideoxygalactose transaminase